MFLYPDTAQGVSEDCTVSQCIPMIGWKNAFILHCNCSEHPTSSISGTICSGMHGVDNGLNSRNKFACFPLGGCMPNHTLVMLTIHAAPVYDWEIYT